MDNFEIMAMPWLDFAEDYLRLRQGLAKDLDSYVCRLGNFSMEVRLQTSSVGIGEDRSPLNVNAKVFQNPRECVKKIFQNPRQCLKKPEAKDPKASIGKSRLENSTGKGEARVIHEFKRKLFRIRAQVKEIQDTLDGKEILDQYNFNWTLPSASVDTLRGLKTHN